MQLVQLLLQHGADVHKLSDDRPRFKITTPLHYAIQAKNDGIVDVLLQSGHDPNYPSLNNVYPLTEAIRTNCVTIVQLLLHYNVVRVNLDRDLFGSWEFPPLYQALYKFKRYRIAQILLDSKRCHLIFHGDSFLSILLWNITNQTFSHRKIAQMLLEAGSDLCCRDRHHNYPFTTIVTTNSRILVLEQARRLLRMLISAGLRPSVSEVTELKRYAANDDDNEFCEFLHNLADTPADLQTQCRKTLRRYFGLYPKDKIHRLPLPLTMLNYLSLSQLA